MIFQVLPASCRRESIHSNSKLRSNSRKQKNKESTKTDIEVHRLRRIYTQRFIYTENNVSLSLSLYVDREVAGRRMYPIQTCRERNISTEREREREIHRYDIWKRRARRTVCSCNDGYQGKKRSGVKGLLSDEKQRE